MNILHITDLHGIHKKYLKVFEILEKENIDVIVNSGDLFPKDGKTLLDIWIQQKKFILEFHTDFMEEIDGRKIHYLAFPGNDDFLCHDEIFDKTISKYGYCYNPVKGNVDVDEFSFIGFDLVPDYPFGLKDRVRMDTLDFGFPKQISQPILSDLENKGTFKEIENWIEYARNLKTIEEELEIKKEFWGEINNQTVFICHPPPRGLGLDVIISGEEVGSEAVTSFIQKNQPKLSLHGHIHESPEISGKFCGWIDKTLCVQPGQSQSGKKLSGCFIKVSEEMEVERFEA